MELVIIMAHIIDGVRIQLIAPDYDKDGKRGGTESLTHKNEPVERRLIQESELRDAIQRQNPEGLTDQGLSKVDPMTRLPKNLVGVQTALDVLIPLGFLPRTTSFITQVHNWKMIAESGKGRKEYTDLVVGKREQDKETKLQQSAQGFTGGR